MRHDVGRMGGLKASVVGVVTVQIATKVKKQGRIIDVQEAAFYYLRYMTLSSQ